MLSLKQSLISSFLCHRSATTCQFDLNMVSYTKLQLDLCNCVKAEIIESTAPPQQPHKLCTIFFIHSMKISFERFYRAELNFCKGCKFWQPKALGGILATSLLHKVFQTPIHHPKVFANSNMKLDFAKSESVNKISKERLGSYLKKSDRQIRVFLEGVEYPRRG